MDLSKVNTAFNTMKNRAENLQWHMNIFINKQDTLNNLNINDYHKDINLLEKLIEDEKLIPIEAP